MVSALIARRAWLVAFPTAVALGLAGCAAPRVAQNSALSPDAHWQGRMSVKVYGTPVQSFSASFDLQGGPERGQLVLSSALGTTFAEIHWSAHSAELRTSREQKAFESLETLAREVTGAEIPIAGLFGWLKGEAGPSGNWQSDLSDREHGRFTAHTVNAAASAELKIVLDP